MLSRRLQNGAIQSQSLKSIQKLEIVNHDTLIQKQLAQFKLHITKETSPLGKLNLISTKTEPGKRERVP